MTNKISDIMVRVLGLITGVLLTVIAEGQNVDPKLDYNIYQERNDSSGCKLVGVSKYTFTEIVNNKFSLAKLMVNSLQGYPSFKSVTYLKYEGATGYYLYTTFAFDSLGNILNYELKQNFTKSKKVIKELKFRLLRIDKNDYTSIWIDKAYTTCNCYVSDASETLLFVTQSTEIISGVDLKTSLPTCSAEKPYAALIKQLDYIYYKYR